MLQLSAVHPDTLLLRYWSTSHTASQLICGLSVHFLLFSILYLCIFNHHVVYIMIGVILYILLGGYPPFHDENQSRLFRKITRADYQFHPDYWGSVSDDAKNLIRGLLTLDMNKRLTVDQALRHPWLGKSAQELAARSLDSNLAELRRYQATRKLRAAVRAVMAMNRMKGLLQPPGVDLSHEAVQTSRAEKTSSSKSKTATKPSGKK